MPTANNNDEDKDGIMDRLAKTLFASPGSPLTAFADQQRIERLENCRQLERVLKACQSANNDAQFTGGDESETTLSEKEEDTWSIPPSRGSVRLARFFNWDNPELAEQHQNNESKEGSDRSALSEAAASFYGENVDGGENTAPAKIKKAERNRFSGSCAREAHELWACRALALGCGNYLADLRSCWSESHLKSQMSGGNEITFENGSEDSCRNIQISMSKCVSKHAAELAERVQRDKKE